VLTERFVVIASTRDMARKVFNSPMFVKPCVVDVAHKLLRPENWVFLDGKAHVDYRKGLNGLFTRQALETYLPGQEEVYDRYFAHFLSVTERAGGAATPFMTVFRELMCAVSCRVFVGRYSSDEAVRKIATDYFHITAALELVNFPIILPFTRPWYGKKAADMVLREFSSCAAKSKVRMAAGGEPDCILDRWVMSMLESKAYRDKLEAAGAEGVPEKPAMLIRWFSDLEIAMTLLTFLFASQDATTSACTWIFQLMADRPEWLDKVREENMRLCGGDVNAPLTMDLLDGMVVTKAVVKETLRYRPPVLMVPYIAKKAFPIAPGYTVPKGEPLLLLFRPANSIRIDGGADDVPGAARPGGLPEPGQLRPAALDHGGRRGAAQELARLRHGPARVHRADVRDAAPHGHAGQGQPQARLAAPGDRQERGD
jgi:sterol 22-desaturase